MALAVLAAGVFAWRAGWLDWQPAPPPHPLAGIEASEIVAISRLTPEGPQPLRGEPLRRAAAVITSLKTAPRLDGRSVVWGSATMLRAVTRDGVALSLQVKPLATGAAVRVTADPTPGHADGAGADAAAIRGLRLNAYRLGPEAAALLPAAG